MGPSAQRCQVRHRNCVNGLIYSGFHQSLPYRSRSPHSTVPFGREDVEGIAELLSAPEIIFSEHIDVTPRYRRMDCDQPLQVFFGINIRCLLDLSGEVEVIPGDDAVSCGGFGTFM